MNCSVPWFFGFSLVSVPLLVGAEGVINTSQYDSLQEAFDAVPETGGMVYIPPGNYELTEPLILRRENTRIEGAGAATHLINRNESGQAALLVRPEGYAADPKSRLWRIQLGNFRISGNPKSGIGVHAQGIQEIFIQGLSVDHHGGHGIFLENCYEDPRVSDSILTYNAKAGLNITDSHDIVVNGNQFEENQDGVRCIDSFNLCMNGNNLDDHLRNGVVIENTYGSVLSGNMIEECNGTAIILDRDSYGITISANVIAHELEGGVDLRDAHGCAISANTFVIVHKFSVRVGKDSGRITLTGNNFSNSYLGDDLTKRPLEHARPMRRDAASGILLDNTSDVTITGNSFSGLPENAVEAIGDCSRLVIATNLVTDMHRLSTAKKPAFNIGTAYASSIVTSNIVQ